MARLKPLLTPAEGVRSPDSGMEQPWTALNRIKNHRDSVASKYDEATRLAFPGRRGITGSPDDGDAYDDTAIIAVQEFASRIQAGVTPNFSRWGAHMAGILVREPDERKEIEAELEVVDDFIFEVINASNFQTEANECYQDLALGTLGIEIEEESEDNPVCFAAIPLAELHFGIGPDSRPDPICRLRPMMLRDIRYRAPMATLPPDLDPSRPVQVAVIWQRDWSEPAAHRYRCTWFMPADGNRVLWQYETMGRGSRALEVARWSKASGEVWGRGQLLSCLPSVRLVNYAMQAVMDHGDMALAGVWSAEDDGVLNAETVKLEPGVLIPRAPGSQPLQNVAPGGNFDIQQFMISEHRENIRKALFTEQLGNPNKTPMSATEVDQRMAELARAIGAPFGRIVLEFVLPIITRVRFILQRRKMIEAMPEVDGKELKLMPTGPLAQGQRLDDIDRTVKYVSTVGQLFGPETAALTIDATETSEYLGDRFGVPARIRRPKKKQQELSAQIAESAQGGMNGEAGAAPGAPAI